MQKQFERAGRLCTLLPAGALVAAAAAAQTQPAVELPAPDPQTIVITATRHAMLATDAPASLSVVTRREIEARGADNVLDALRGEPGLSLEGRAVGGRKVFTVRGMESRHALFLVDGQRIGASDGVVGASDFQYDWIPVEDIERIEVVRGPMSVLYGSEAMGGVVNVITRPPGDIWRFGATAEGSHADGGRGGGGWRAGARADGPLGSGLFLRAGAAATQVDAVESPVDPRISEIEARHKRDAWLGLSYRGLEGHQFELDHREGDEQREGDARERGGRRRYHVTTNDIDRAVSTASWQAQWNDATETQLRAYRATIDVANYRTEGVAVNVPQTVTEQVLEGSARRVLGAAHGLTAGFEARNEGLDDPGLPGGSGILRHRALYVQDEWTPLQPLTLTLGLRHDRASAYGHEWSPRAYAVWRVGGPWTVKGGYSEGFKVPNLKQVVPGERPEGPNIFIGNPTLRPERSKAFEVGFGFSQGATQAQLMLFDQRVDELIEIRLVAAGPTPGLGTYTYENLARARLRGVEASVVQPLGGGWTGTVNYTYLDATNGSGQRLDRRPRHSASARLDWQGGIWRLGALVEHAADQQLPQAPPKTGSVGVPSLTTVGAQVTAALPAGLELTLGVRNLTNLNLAEKSPLYTQVEAPRTWRLTLRGRW